MSIQRPHLHLASSSTPSLPLSSWEKRFENYLLKNPNLKKRFAHRTEEYGNITIKDHTLGLLYAFMTYFSPSQDVQKILKNSGWNACQFTDFLMFVDHGLGPASNAIGFKGGLRNAYASACIISFFKTNELNLYLPDRNEAFSFLFARDAFMEYLKLAAPTQQDLKETAQIILDHFPSDVEYPEQDLQILSLYYQVKWASYTSTQNKYFDFTPRLTLHPIYQERIDHLIAAVKCAKDSRPSSSTPSQGYPRFSKQTHCFIQMTSSLPYRVYALWKQGLITTPDLTIRSNQCDALSRSWMKLALTHAGISSLTVKRTFALVERITCLYPLNSGTLAEMQARGSYFIEPLKTAFENDRLPMEDVKQDYFDAHDPAFQQYLVFDIEEMNQLLLLLSPSPFSIFKAIQSINPFLKIIPHNEKDLRHFLSLLATWKQSDPQEFERLLAPQAATTLQFLVALRMLKAGFQTPNTPLVPLLHQDPLDCQSCELDHTRDPAIIDLFGQLIDLLSNQQKTPISFTGITDAQLRRLKGDIQRPYRHLSSPSTWIHSTIWLTQLKKYDPQSFQKYLPPALIRPWLKEIQRERDLQKQRVDVALRLITEEFSPNAKGKKIQLPRISKKMTEEDALFFEFLHQLNELPYSHFSQHENEKKLCAKPPCDLFTEFSPKHIQRLLHFYRSRSHLWPHLIKQILEIKLTPGSPLNANLKYWIEPLQKEIQTIEESFAYINTALRAALTKPPLYPPHFSEKTLIHIKAPLPIFLASSHLTPFAKNRERFFQNPTPLGKHGWNLILVSNQQAEDAIRPLLSKKLLKEMNFYHTSKLNTAGIPLISSPFDSIPESAQAASSL